MTQKKARYLWESIRYDLELKYHELEGFKRGVLQGKSMDVSVDDMRFQVKRQFRQLTSEFYPNYDKPERIKKIKRRIADLRNVAGCLFLKIQELEKK